MAIQIQGNGGTVAEVDGTTFRAVRVTARPVDYGALGAYAVGLQSGTMAAALTANSEVYQFRWPDASNFAVVLNVHLSAGANVAATAAGLQAFRLTVARAWSAAGSGGTRATLTGNNCKLRTSMATSLVNDCGISSTAALTAGTKSLDSTDLSSIGYGIGTGAITTSTSLQWVERTALFDAADANIHPLVLAGTGGGEGFVIRNHGANNHPATATWILSVSTVWAEVTAY